MELVVVKRFLNIKVVKNVEKHIFVKNAIANYINPFSAALERDNFYATQFHPEKSGPVGEKILKNFLDL